MGKIFRWTLLFVVLVIFASGVVAVYTVFFNTADDVVVPPLTQMSVLDAISEAKRMGFIVRTEEVASSLPRGQILAQSPEPGIKVRKEKVLLLQVSRGSARRAVPDVRGRIVAQAQSIVREQGFEVGDIIYIRDSIQPPGAVIAQSPAAPANVPGDKKIDLLVNQTGAGIDGRIVVPDVAQMTERQARELLTTSGLQVVTVDSVYSPNSTNGYVIGTRPTAGAAARVGDGIRLRIATTERPAGVPAPPAQTSTTAASPSGTPSSSQIIVSVPGQGDIVVGERANATTPPAQTRVVDTNVSVFDQRPQVIPNPALTGTIPAPAVQPAPPAPPSQMRTTPQSVNNLPVGGKIAKIRYQVPPLARSLNLKIELVDPSGSKVLLDRNAQSGEYVSLDAPYSRECAVTIYLGGEFVWQDRYM
jgi:serine/threonine-protein kinase